MVSACLNTAILAIAPLKTRDPSGMVGLFPSVSGPANAMTWLVNGNMVLSPGYKLDAGKGPLGHVSAGSLLKTVRVVLDATISRATMDHTPTGGRMLEPQKRWPAEPFSFQV